MTHEEIHYKIFEDFGCNSTITYSNLYTSGVTSPNNCSLDKDDWRVVVSLNNQNEIVGYNFHMLIEVITTLFFFLMLYLIYLKYKENKSEYLNSSFYT